MWGVSVRDRVALARAAGSAGLRREDAACRRMTKEKERGPSPVGRGLKARRASAMREAERVRVVRFGRGPTLTLSRKSDRLTALRRSSPLPTGEGGRVRVHEPKRLRPLTQEAVSMGIRSRYAPRPD